MRGSVFGSKCYAKKIPNSRCVWEVFGRGIALLFVHRASAMLSTHTAGRGIGMRKQKALQRMQAPDILSMSVITVRPGVASG